MMNAQGHIEQYRRIRSIHRAMARSLQQEARRAYLLWASASFEERERMERGLQQREQELARFEWQYGLFS